MIEFFKQLFRPEASGATAKERLRLVLLSDHLALAPDVVDALRADLIAVISKYVEVDESQVAVSFERRDSDVAMLANIPIRGMRTRPPSPPPPPVVAPEPPPALAAAPVAEISLAEAVPAAPRPRKRRRRRPYPAPATS